MQARRSSALTLRTQDIDPAADIIGALGRLRSHVEHAPGHAHLYGEFAGILADIAGYRRSGGDLTEALAREILTTVDLLFRENMVGRRPWTGDWETYFARCMEDANGLLKEFGSFAGSAAFCPLGFCNRFLDAFAHMDRHDREYEERYPRWSRRFARLASLAAEMFSLVADSAGRVQGDFLEHPDDSVFTWLITGYAKSETPAARELLQRYLADDEAWVRQLARNLIQERCAAQQPPEREK